MSFGYKDNFHFRPIVKEDEKNVRNIIFGVLKDYGLKVDIKGVDHDLFNIVSYYKPGLFGVVEDTETDEIVGSFALYPLNDKEIELRKMYLLKEYRNKGIGSWCIKFCEAYAQNAGFQYIVLESASVLKGAIQLYTKKGYAVEIHCNVVERCDVFMRKKLH